MPPIGGNRAQPEGFLFGSAKMLVGLVYKALEAALQH